MNVYQYCMCAFLFIQQDGHYEKFDYLKKGCHSKNTPMDDISDLASVKIQGLFNTNYFTWNFSIAKVISGVSLINCFLDAQCSCTASKMQFNTDAILSTFLLSYVSIKLNNFSSTWYPT